MLFVHILFAFSCFRSAAASGRLRRRGRVCSRGSPAVLNGFCCANHARQTAYFFYAACPRGRHAARRRAPRCHERRARMRARLPVLRCARSRVSLARPARSLPNARTPAQGFFLERCEQKNRRRLPSGGLSKKKTKGRYEGNQEVRSLHAFFTPRSWQSGNLTSCSPRPCGGESQQKKNSRCALWWIA